MVSRIKINAVGLPAINRKLNFVGTDQMVFYVEFTNKGLIPITVCMKSDLSFGRCPGLKQKHQFRFAGVRENNQQTEEENTYQRSNYPFFGPVLSLHFEKVS